MPGDASKRRRRDSPQALVAAALVFVNTGCSFSMPTASNEPGKRSKKAAEQCGGYGWPVVDTISAGVGVVNIAIAGSADSGDQVTWYGLDIGRDAGLALGISQAVLFGAGAVYGYVRASQCAAARKHYRLDQEGHETAETDEEGSVAGPGDADGLPSDIEQPDPPRVPPTTALEFYESLPAWSA